MRAKKVTELSLLTALALIIFIVELRIPNLVPIYGVKLGLANIITVYAVYNYSVKETAMIVFARVFIGSLFGGGFSAMIYSLAGALFCLTGMILIKKIISQKYIWLCSIIGAIFHNLGQITMAIILMKTVAVIGYLPILIVTGCIAGFFTGICAQMIIKRGIYHK